MEQHSGGDPIDGDPTVDGDAPTGNHLSPFSTTPAPPAAIETILLAVADILAGLHQAKRDAEASFTLVTGHLNDVGAPLDDLYQAIINHKHYAQFRSLRQSQSPTPMTDTWRTQLLEVAFVRDAVSALPPSSEYTVQLLAYLDKYASELRHAIDASLDATPDLHLTALLERREPLYSALLHRAKRERDRRRLNGVYDTSAGEQASTPTGAKQTFAAQHINRAAGIPAAEQTSHPETETTRAEEQRSPHATETQLVDVLTGGRGGLPRVAQVLAEDAGTLVPVPVDDGHTVVRTEGDSIDSAVAPISVAPIGADNNDSVLPVLADIVPSVTDGLVQAEQPLGDANVGVVSHAVALYAQVAAKGGALPSRAHELQTTAPPPITESCPLPEDPSSPMDPLLRDKHKLDRNLRHPSPIGLELSPSPPTPAAVGGSFKFEDVANVVVSPEGRLSFHVLTPQEAGTELECEASIDHDPPTLQDPLHGYVSTAEAMHDGLSIAEALNDSWPPPCALPAVGPRGLPAVAHNHGSNEVTSTKPDRQDSRNLVVVTYEERVVTADENVVTEKEDIEAAASCPGPVATTSEPEANECISLDKAEPGQPSVAKKAHERWPNSKLNLPQNTIEEADEVMPEVLNPPETNDLTCAAPAQASDAFDHATSTETELQSACAVSAEGIQVQLNSELQLAQLNIENDGHVFSKFEEQNTATSVKGECKMELEDKMNVGRSHSLSPLGSLIASSPPHPVQPTDRKVQRLHTPCALSADEATPVPPPSPSSATASSGPELGTTEAAPTVRSTHVGRLPSTSSMGGDPASGALSPADRSASLVTATWERQASRIQERGSSPNAWRTKHDATPPTVAVTSGRTPAGVGPSPTVVGSDARRVAPSTTGHAMTTRSRATQSSAFFPITHAVPAPLFPYRREPTTPIAFAAALDQRSGPVSALLEGQAHVAAARAPADTLQRSAPPSAPTAGTRSPPPAAPARRGAPNAASKSASPAAGRPRSPVSGPTTPAASAPRPTRSAAAPMTPAATSARITRSAAASTTSAATSSRITRSGAASSVAASTTPAASSSRTTRSAAASAASSSRTLRSATNSSATQASKTADRPRWR